MLVLYVSTSSLIDAVLDFPLVPLWRMCGACTFRPPLPVLNVRRMLYLVLGDSLTLTFFKYHRNSICILRIIVSPKNVLGFEVDVQHIQNDQIFWTAVLFTIVVFLNGDTCLLRKGAEQNSFFVFRSHTLRTTTAMCIIETFPCKAWRHIFTHSAVFIPALKLTKWKLLLHISEVTYMELLLSFYY